MNIHTETKAAAVRLTSSRVGLLPRRKGAATKTTKATKKGLKKVQQRTTKTDDRSLRARQIPSMTRMEAWKAVETDQKPQPKYKVSL